jgi:hypothetical protein
MFRDDPDGDATRLVEALCAVPVAAWRSAAFAALRDPRAPIAATALEVAQRTADRVRLWDALDDLETALHRLTTDEAAGVVRDAREREWIRTATRRSVSALVCRAALDDAHVRALASPLLQLVEGGVEATLPMASAATRTSPIAESLLRRP